MRVGEGAIAGRRCLCRGWLRPDGVTQPCDLLSCMDIGTRLLAASRVYEGQHESSSCYSTWSFRVLISSLGISWQNHKPNRWRLGRQHLGTEAVLWVDLFRAQVSSETLIWGLAGLPDVLLAMCMSLCSSCNSESLGDPGLPGAEPLRR